MFLLQWIFFVPSFFFPFKGKLHSLSKKLHPFATVSGEASKSVLDRKNEKCRGEKCLKGTGSVCWAKFKVQSVFTLLSSILFYFSLVFSTWNSINRENTFFYAFISVFHIKYHSILALIYFLILYLNSRINNNVFDLKWIPVVFTKKM